MSAWGLTSAALSSIVPAAYSVYYGKDTTRALGLTLGLTGAVATLWGLIGYSMIYGKPLSTGVIGTEDFGTINKVNNSSYSNYVHVVFELNFALTTLAIIAGAIGHRFKTEWFVLYSIAALLLTYTPQAMWQWNPAGWAASYGIMDYAGGLIVHLTAGVATLVLGALLGYKGEEKSGASVSNLLLSVAAVYLGTFALYAGKSSTTNPLVLGNSALALVNTQMAAAGGVVSYGFAQIAYPLLGAQPLSGKPTVEGAAKGALIGLISASAGAGIIAPMWTILNAVIAVTLVYIAGLFLGGVKIAGFDVFLTHGFGGAISVALTGLFADISYGNSGITVASGSFYGNAIMLGKQCAGISYIILMTVVSTACLFIFGKILAGFVFGTTMTEEEAAEAPVEAPVKSEA